MSKKLNIVVLFISIASFIALIIFLSLLLGEHFQVESCGCPKMVSQNFIVLFIVLSVIFAGGIFYYLLSLQIQKKNEKLEFGLDTIMKFLDKDEKSIIKQTRENKGQISQNKIKGITRLRAHRAIKKLEEKGILDINRKDKTNKIKINKNFKLK